MREDWVRIVHVARNQTGIDDDAYRGILSGQGLTSSKDIETAAQFCAIMDSFKRLGFRYSPHVSSSPGGKRKTTVNGSPGFISSKQEYYIKGLWSLASRAKDEKSLSAMIRRIGHVDDIKFLTRRNASAVIQALRKICWDAGINPDHREGGQQCS